MFDEIYECQQYLNGENIVPENLYRMCYMMARYHNENLPDTKEKRFQIRKEIFNWAEKHNQYIKYSVNNDIIERIFHYNPPKLRGGGVYVGEIDIKEINSRFDNYKTKLVALAMLCFAKAHADENGEFCMSSVTLSLFLGINRKSMRQRHIRELINYCYLEEVRKPKLKNKNVWDNPFEEQSIKYRILVPFANEGGHCLKNNAIQELAEELFGKRRIRTK